MKAMIFPYILGIFVPGGFHYIWRPLRKGVSRKSNITWINEEVKGLVASLPAIFPKDSPSPMHNHLNGSINKDNPIA